MPAQNNTINQPVTIIANFSNGKVAPLAMRWQKRLVRFRACHLVTATRLGRDKIYTVSASSSQENIYELTFNSASLVWTLIRIWQDD